MSEESAGEILAWDSSALHHALSADRADVLLHLSGAASRGTTRHITTLAVVQELAGNGLGPPPEIETVPVDGLLELVALADWVGRLSSSRHNRGEATICAWAQVHNAIAIVDDRDARTAAQRAGLNVHGSLWLVARAVQAGSTDLGSAGNLVDTLLAAGARYPFAAGGFAVWMKTLSP